MLEVSLNFSSLVVVVYFISITVPHGQVKRFELNPGGQSFFSSVLLTVTQN